MDEDNISVVVFRISYIDLYLFPLFGSFIQTLYVFEHMNVIVCFPFNNFTNIKLPFSL